MNRIQTLETRDLAQSAHNAAAASARLPASLPARLPAALPISPARRAARTSNLILEGSLPRRASRGRRRFFMSLGRIHRYVYDFHIERGTL